MTRDWDAQYLRYLLFLFNDKELGHAGKKILARLWDYLMSHPHVELHAVWLWNPRFEFETCVNVWLSFRRRPRRTLMIQRLIIISVWVLDQYRSGVKYSLYSDPNWSTCRIDWNMQNTSQEKESNVSEKYCCIVFFLLVSTIEKIKGFYLIIKIW
jgi:hypothetical protein